jgi:hypothetical protein
MLALAMLGAGLCACASQPLVIRPASACSTLVPEGWRDGVDSAPIPTEDTVGKWIAFGDAQTGQLDKANGRTSDTLSIVQKCEARDAETAKALKPRPWWRIF